MVMILLMTMEATVITAIQFLITITITPLTTVAKTNLTTIISFPIFSLVTGNNIELQSC